MDPGDSAGDGGLVPQLQNADPRQRGPAGEINGAPYYHFLLNNGTQQR